MPAPAAAPCMMAFSNSCGSTFWLWEIGSRTACTASSVPSANPVSSAAGIVRLVCVNFVAAWNSGLAL